MSLLRTRTTITWYTGIDLHNPFCDRKSRWTPTDEALIVAVTEKWSLRPHCGEFMEISTTDAPKGKENRKVVARVVDLCGGCKAEIAHADLSKAAFLKLYDLDVGLVTNREHHLLKTTTCMSLTRFANSQDASSVSAEGVER